jgi:hypothetical protein
MKRTLCILAFALLPAVAQADSINTVASELRALVDEPFRFGVAQDLAGNILLAQTQVTYAGPESLELSIESVVRAIGIDEATYHAGYVGFSNVDPIAWLSSTIAIDPGATVGITPNALFFGSEIVQESGQVPVPESSVLVLLCFGLILSVFAGLFRFAPVATRRIP